MEAGLYAVKGHIAVSTENTSNRLAENINLSDASKSFPGLSKRAAHEAMQPTLAAVNAANKALADRLETVRNGGSRPVPRGAETLCGRRKRMAENKARSSES